MTDYAVRDNKTGYWLAEYEGFGDDEGVAYWTADKSSRTFFWPRRSAFEIRDCWRHRGHASAVVVRVGEKP